MNNSIPIFDEPTNEPVLNYEPESKERKNLIQKLKELKNKELEIPIIIGGKEVKTGNIGKCVMPHEHNYILAYYHKAGEKEVQLAIENSLKARKIWDEFSWVDRISIFKKAADLLSTKWRSTLNAATMLCQSKNAYQAEIDAACELTDFFRFNSYYATKIYLDQPKSVEGVWNRMEYRPLEGFIFAVTPFNFTSISGNLPTAPAIMTVWDLAVLMISYSDNIATNICIDLVGMEYTNDLLRTFGLRKTHLRRKMMDEDAWRRGDENVSTPGELVALLAAIENRNGVDESVSSAVIEIMKAQRKGMLGEVVPRDIPVANKPGGLAHVKVDAGLIYFPNRAFAVSVMGAFLSDDDSRKLTDAARVAVDGMKLLATCSELGRA